MHEDIVKKPKLNKKNKWVVEYKDMGRPLYKEFDTQEEALKFYQEKYRFFQSWLEMAMAYFRDQRDD